ncbi:uvrD-like helicase C-terminal domain protein, partial [Vibrio parahaemolyticus V-223/04]
SDY